MDKGSEQTPHQRRWTDGKQAQEKLLSIIYLREMQSNNSEILLSLLEWWKSKTLTIPNAGEDVEQQFLPRTHCWWKCKLVQPLYSGSFCKTTFFLYDPVITYIGTYLNELIFCLTFPLSFTVIFLNRQN